MTSDILNIKILGEYLYSGLMSEAFGLIDNAMLAAPHLRSFYADVERLRDEYRLMADYALRGLPDPGLDATYADLASRVRSLADMMVRQILTADSPTLYYNTLRYELTEPSNAPALLMEEYRKLVNKLSMAALTENPREASIGLTRSAESVEKRFFNRVWTLAPMSVADSALIAEAVADPGLPRHFKLLAISAVTLGLLEWYDENRMRLLMDIYADGQDAEAAVRSLCGLLTAMWIHRDRPMSHRLAARFALLTDKDGWEDDVRMVNMQFIRSRDTERITRKFTEEVIPEMMKLRPEIEKLRHTQVDPEAMEENPEWAEMLEKSGVADRLKELQELQEDGGDVMMATFSRLKTFPFFNDIANWFLPFHESHSIIMAEEDPTVSSLCAMTGSVPMLCDNDKYSMVLSLAQLPESQRQMMTGQLRMQAEQLEQMRLSSLQTAPREREAIAASYVRDLYRFFKLFRRKGEFTDPFASGLNLPGLPLLAPIFDDADTLSLIGEFYFKRKYYTDAYDTLLRLSCMIPPSAPLYQKMGYCRQAIGDYAGAIDHYEQSELLNAESRWTMRRLAACHRAIGNWEKAVDYYKTLAVTKPDDDRLALNIGLSLVKLRCYDEALQYLFKAEFLGNSSEKSIRAIVWCTLLGADYDRCAKYTDILMSSSTPTPTDLLNAGHLQLLTGHPGEAAALYARSIAGRDFDTRAFLSELESDRCTIAAFAGISPRLLAIVTDKALSLAKGQGSNL